MPRRPLVLSLIVVPLLLGLFLSSGIPSVYNYHSGKTSNLVDEILESGANPEKAEGREFTIAQDTKSGTLNPISITHSGYQVTASQRARTDTGSNTIENITIDETYGWVAESTEIEVSNLRKLYAINGTFEDGPDPWFNSTYDSSGGDQVQYANYSAAGEYISCINYGEKKTHPVLGDSYTHYYESEISWEQSITNSPQVNNFSLSFKFRYYSGPLDPQPYDLSGDVELRIYIHTVTYYLSIGTLESRGDWYSITDYPIYLAGAPASFDVGFGVYIEYDDLVLEEDGDYDDDGQPDGLENAQKIEVHLDDIEFTSVFPVEYDDVELTFHASGYSSAITGTAGATGTSSITNPAFWDVDPLQIEITSNDTVSFDYSVTTYFLRIMNSSWTTDPMKHGVTYTISSGHSADYTLYTYVTSSGEYENITLNIEIPVDWENVTVLDPLLNDITSLCEISPGLIVADSSLFSRVGWWKIQLQGNNYAKDISIQIQDQNTLAWTEESLFRPTNVTRAQIELGTSGEVVSMGSPVNITWILPNGTVWVIDTQTTILSGQVNSSSWWFGGMNTSAGQWEVEVVWENGTEIAYGIVIFDLYHSASISAKFPSIETDHGLVISNLMHLNDSDTGEYLLDDSVTVEANWSSVIVSFSANLAKKWWEADFDTATLAGGVYTVVVNASMPYYDPVQTSFTVIITYTAELVLPSIGGLVETELNERYVIDMKYLFSNGTGIESASVSLAYSGPSLGIVNESVMDLGGGNYSVGITGILSGDYFITITVSKSYHQTDSETFSLTVGEVSTFFSSMNGSADLVELGTSYRLVLNYTNSTGDGLSGATVQVTQLSPSTGLSTGLVIDEGEGFYSILLTPTSSASYTIVLRANITNHVTQYVTFTIIVTDIQTTLTPSSTSAFTLINQSYVLQLSYEDASYNGIAGATITLVNLPTGLSYSVYDVGGGLYNVSLTPSVSEATSFQLSFRASFMNYETSSTSFTLSVQLIGTDLIAVNGMASGSVTVLEEHTFILSFVRTDQTLNITGAILSIETSPSTGLSYSVGELESLYYLDFATSSIGIWQITITASKTSFVQSVILLELEVLAISTSFASLNGTADVVGFGLDYTLYLDYSNSTGDGLSAATVQVISVNPSSGLTVGIASDEGDGVYKIVLTPTTSSTFTINLRANITNHATQYLTFTLMVTDVATVLIPNSVGATISIDMNHTLQLTYEDEESNPILGATVILLNAPIGISYDIQEIGGGVYNVSLQPLVTEATSFQLSFRASLENYQTASTAFSLFVQKIPTSLEILQGSTKGEMVVIDSYSLVLAYVRTDTTQNITLADLSITASPLEGLSSVVFPIGDTYMLTFTASRVGIWQITISANKTNFVTSLIQVELEVTAIETTFVCLNGTAGLTELGTPFRLVLSFTNSTDDGISLATVVASEITPSTGLSSSLTTDEGYGFYSIDFTPSDAASYTIVLRANASNHVTRYLTFSLTVLPVQTVLIPHVSGATISLDKDFVLQLTFEDEFSNPIEDATIEIVDLPDGIVYTVTEIGLGVYNVTLIPSVTERASFQIAFRGSKAYHQSSTTAFSLLVREIPTELVIVSGVASESLLFTEEYDLWVAFIRTDTVENISGASLEAFITPAIGVETTIEQVGDLYHLQCHSNTTGTWQISLRANRSGYESGILALEFDVNEIDTALNEITFLESLIFGHSYTFTFEYEMDNGTRIRDANIIISGTGNEWLEVEELASGIYNVTLRPDDVGNFEIDFEFSRNGFVSKTSTLSFGVERVTISVTDIQGLTGLEGQLTTLSLRIVETGTGSAITGATVAFQLVVDGVAGTSMMLEEIEPGRYASSFIMPSSESQVRMRVYVDKENHEMEEDLAYMEASITPSISELASLTRTVTTFLPLIILATISVTTFQARRYLNKRERIQNLEALAVKRRFDDVKNLVGVVVLHRGSGIPIYSRMLRAGFDDSLISAFITAISQFRSEFDVTEKEWQITPISDIIMAVKTQNLICAFITMGTPTPTQQERMIQFGKSVGFVFDSMFEEAPVLTIDDETEERFDDLFDELLDMNLHQKHKIIDIKGLPKGPRCLNQTITEFKSLDGFDLDAMADRMAACGIEEARAYKIILDAIRNEQMIPVEESDDIEPKPDITADLVTHFSDDSEDIEMSMDDELSEEE